MSTPPHPPSLLYNKTYTLHRISAFNPPPPSAYASHAKNLATLLRTPPLDTTAAPNTTGALVSVRWEPLQLDDAPITLSTGTAPSAITLTYESATHTLLLLSPLLLTRCPRPILATCTHFLETSFDIHISPLHLPSTFLKSTLATWIDRLDAKVGEGEVVVTWKMKEEEGLRSWEVRVRGEDVGGFRERGGEEGEGAGFWRGLEDYCREIMGVQVGGWEVVKVATGGWVLGGEGRWKVFKPVGEEEKGAGMDVLRGLEMLAGGKELGEE